MQGADLVVKQVAALVEAAQGGLQHLPQGVAGDHTIHSQVGRQFQQVQGAAGIAVGLAGDLGETACRGPGRAAQRRHAPRQHRLYIPLLQRAQLVHPGARQQGVVEFKGRVFGGGTDKYQGAVFHIGQERVLLGFVEAMYLVDKQHRIAPGLLLASGLGNRLADIPHPGQHRGELQEVGLRMARRNARQGGFAHARRAPENHRVQLAAGYRLTQGLAHRQDVLLPRVIVEAGGAQARCQRLVPRR